MAASVPSTRAHRPCLVSLSTKPVIWLRSNLTNTRLIGNVEERSTATVPVNGAFNVSGLDLAPVHLDLAVFPDERLRQVERMVVIFRVPKHDGDLVLSRTCTDLLHLWTIAAQRVAHVLLDHLEINGALPTRQALARPNLRRGNRHKL